MIRYIGKFVQHLSAVSALSRQLTQKGVARKTRHQEAFNELKQRIANTPTLKFLDVQQLVTYLQTRQSVGMAQSTHKKVATSLMHPGVLHQQKAITHLLKTKYVQFCMVAKYFTITSTVRK